MLWLVFDIPSQALQERQGEQGELGEEEATRQRGEYRRLLAGHENVVVLDADQPLDRVVAQAECAIASQLARRTTQRLGLPQEGDQQSDRRPSSCCSSAGARFRC